MDNRSQGSRTKAVVVCSASAFMVCLLAYVPLLRSQFQMAGEIKELRRAVNRLGNLPADGPDAEAAAAQGREAIRKGDWELGQLYFVNALTNAPRRVNYLETYADAVLQQHDIPPDALDRLTSVLQVSAYQVDSRDVPKVLRLIEGIEQARKRLPGSEIGAAGPSQQVDWDGRLAKLKAVDANIWKDSPQLAHHLKSLEDLISDLDEQDNPPPELRAEAVAELARWSEIVEAAKQCAYIDGCLNRLQQGEDLSSQRAVAIVQAAENALPALWSHRPSMLPEELRIKVDGYPMQVQSFVERIGQMRSTSILKRIQEALRGDSDKSETQKWEDKCIEIDRQLKEAQRLAAQLSSTDAMLEAQRLIEKRSEDLRRCRSNQYYEYQREVIRICDAAFKDYMGYRFGLSEADARRVFIKSSLAKVDQSLLNPEVSRIFNDVLAKLTAEMGPVALVDTEKEMGTREGKIRLEDF